MPRIALRLLSVLLLGLLLVYTPNILTAVDSHPAVYPAPTRILMRVAVCTLSDQKPTLLINDLTRLVHTRKGNHLRLFYLDSISAEDPRLLTADLCIFSAQALHASAYPSFFLPLSSASADTSSVYYAESLPALYGTALLAAIPVSSSHPHHAKRLLALLLRTQTPVRANFPSSLVKITALGYNRHTT